MRVQPKNVLVFTTWSYKDGLIQAATLPYLKILGQITGGDIYLLCWEQPALALTDDEYETEKAKLLEHRIHLLRMPYHKNKIQAALGWGLKLIQLIRLSYSCKIRYYHAFATPAGGMALLASWFRNVQLTVDSMEPHADLMAETGVWPKTSKLYRLVFALERKLVRRADKLIAISKSIKPYLQQHYGIDPPPSKLYYRPLCVDASLFRPMPPDYSILGWKEKKARIIGVYTGKLGGMYYDVEFCAFIRSCITYWKGDFHLLFCTSMPIPETTRFLESQGIPENYFTIRFVPLPHLPAYLALADFGLSFSRLSEARQYGCPTKNAEYWAAELPVVATNAILDDTREMTVNPYLGVVLTEDDLVHPEPQIAQLDIQIQQRPWNRARIRAYAIRERSFDQVQNVYGMIYTTTQE